MTNDHHEYHVTTPITGVMASPSHNTECISEALYGEPVSLIETQGLWLKVRQQHDGYAGFIHQSDLSPIKNEESEFEYATHWVHHRSTLLFKEPDIKSPVMHRVPFHSQLTLSTQDDGSFSETQCGHYVWSKHCLPNDQTYSAGPLTVAKQHFLGTPYRWGGRTPAGTDCSGLIQALARSQGLSIPRDSGDQELFVETLVDENDYQPMDLVFWPGHTGILVSPTQLLHATAFTLDCVIEPLTAVIQRAGPASSVRRLFERDFENLA